TLSAKLIARRSVFPPGRLNAASGRDAIPRLRSWMTELDRDSRLRQNLTNIARLFSAMQPRAAAPACLLPARLACPPAPRLGLPGPASAAAASQDAEKPAISRQPSAISHQKSGWPFSSACETRPFSAASRVSRSARRRQLERNARALQDQLESRLVHGF